MLAVGEAKIAQPKFFTGDCKAFTNSDLGLWESRLVGPLHHWDLNGTKISQQDLFDSEST